MTGQEAVREGRQLLEACRFEALDGVRRVDAVSLEAATDIFDRCVAALVAEGDERDEQIAWYDAQLEIERATAVKAVEQAVAERDAAKQTARAYMQSFENALEALGENPAGGYTGYPLRNVRAEQAVAERDKLRKALERIALGIEGRRKDPRPDERDMLPLTDWQLARAALADVSRGDG